MTVAIGWRHEGLVVMGADSMWSDGRGMVWPTGLQKIHEKAVRGERILIAAAGPGALHGFVEHELDLEPPSDASGADAWAHGVAAVLTEAAERTKCLNKDGDEIAGAFLMAWRDRLWELTHSMAFPCSTWAAIGSGYQLALGALWVQHNLESIAGMEADPSVMIARAVAAACDFDTNCAGPAFVAITDRGPDA
jgi:ATP-dependent protease HslVU (ClpYQ) peptidase subunit